MNNFFLLNHNAQRVKLLKVNHLIQSLVSFFMDEVLLVVNGCGEG